MASGRVRMASGEFDYTSGDIVITHNLVCMQIISKLSDMIEEELNDAEKYIRCAMAHKEDNRQLADTFYELSGEEMRHMQTLHEQVVKLIDAYRRENGNPPEHMQFLYDYLHKRHIEHATDINLMRDSYKR